MAVGLATGLRTTRVDVIKTGIDAGGAAGKLRLYDGIRPATGGAATNLIVELTCTYPCAPGAAAGVLTLSTISSAAAILAGTNTATWGRFVTSAGTFVLDCSVGTIGTEVILTSTSITLGDTVDITSAVFTEGNP